MRIIINLLEIISKEFETHIKMNQKIIIDRAISILTRLDNLELELAKGKGLCKEPMLALIKEIKGE